MGLVSVWIDGSPMLVKFEGTVDIERMSDGVTVAVRPVTPESRVSVMPDDGELNRLRKLNADMKARHRDFQRWWNRKLNQMDKEFAK
jgi:hypothetical protein